MVLTTFPKSTLTPQRRALLETLQHLNFGRLEDLYISGGEPVLDPPPRILREVKFGGDNGPRAEKHKADFLLKSQLVELFTFLDDFRDGCISVLEVKHGLPFRLVVAESAA